MKAAFVGLLGGFVALVAVTAVAVVIAQRKLAASMHCVDGVCDGAVQFAHVRHIEGAFLIGFAAAFVWFLRRQRLSE